MPGPLTKKQRLIFDYLRVYIETHGYSPSYREIAKKFSLASIGTVAEHINNLVTKGYLNNEDNEARSITVRDIKAEALAEALATEIPLAGLITAGKPIEAVEDNETIAVPKYMIRDKDYFALKVKGESMIEDGINDGDFVVIEKKNTAENGEVIVALLENQLATLKRYYKEPGYIRLQPANAKMKPLKVKNVQVQGKVVGLIRKY